MSRKYERYTIEDWNNAVRLYGNASTMKKKNSALYQYGARHKLLKDTNWPNPTRYRSYSFEEFCEEAQRCGNQSTMKKFNPALFSYGRRRGWDKTIVWSNRLSRFGYTEEQLKKEVFNNSRKFHSRGEFAVKDSRDYQIALKRGWLDEMYWLEPKKNMVKDRINYIYVYKFEPQKTVYVGETFHGSTRDYQHRIRGPVFEFAKRNSIEIPEPIILEDNLDRINEVRKQEHYWKLYYISLGYNTLNKGKTGEFSGSLGSAPKKWTRKKCYELALLCSSSNEMRKKSESAYDAACRNNWIKDYTWFVAVSGKPKAVLQYTKNGRFIRRWNSLTEAATVYCRGLTGNICRCCKGRKKSAYGYVWKYADE